MRIGIVSPKLLIPLYSFFKSIACAEGVVHALHRRLAKDIYLRVAPYCESQEIEKLSVCDQCTIGVGHMKKMSYQHECESDTHNWKFHFDTMDTLRYWYDDLERLFACTEEEIATECDYFVAQFGITDQSASEWGKRYLVNEDYSKTSNGHGSIPTVETLEKYAEWHSMFYVADKYRQTKCQIDDEDSSYEDWLNCYLPGKADFWCFEFRNYIPLIPFFWNFEKSVKDKPDRRYFIPSDLALTIIEHGSWISLNVEYHAHFQQSNRYIRNDSAFIEKENIDQLVAEMKKPYAVLSHFYFGEDEYGNDEQQEVTIYPTCDVITTFPDYALDKKDLLLKDYLATSNYLMGASDGLAKHLFITKEKQVLHSRVYDYTSLPIQTYHWSEPENESGYEKHSTYGHLVAIEKKHLLDILKERNQAIVFEVAISFEDDSYRFYGKSSKPAKEKVLIFLDIDSEGKIVFYKHQLSDAE